MSESTIPAAEATYSAFFYGTLMHPKVLCRVINNDGLHLEVAPAILKSYIRHHVWDASYPAIISYELSSQFLNTDVPDGHRCVKGVITRGLTRRDMALIKYFEGNSYRLVTVHAHPVGDFIQMKDALNDGFVEQLKKLQDIVSPEGGTSPPISVATYIWDCPIKELTPDIWSFKTFVKDKLKIWL